MDNQILPANKSSLSYYAIIISAVLIATVSIAYYFYQSKKAVVPLPVSTTTPHGQISEEAIKSITTPAPDAQPVELTPEVIKSITTPDPKAKPVEITPEVIKSITSQ